MMLWTGNREKKLRLKNQKGFSHFFYKKEKVRKKVSHVLNLWQINALKGWLVTRTNHT